MPVAVRGVSAARGSCRRVVVALEEKPSEDDLSALVARVEAGDSGILLRDLLVTPARRQTPASKR